MLRLALSISFILALLLLGPIATIWSLNTLFPVLAIPYNWETWSAMVIIVGALKSSVTVRK